MEAKKIADLIAEAAEEKKANNVSLIDIQKASFMASYFVIASGDSIPQLRAIVAEIEAALKKHQVKDFIIEGAAESGWMIVDAGGAIAHIMHEKERAYYNLEELWGQQGVIYHL